MRDCFQHAADAFCWCVMTSHHRTCDFASKNLNFKRFYVFWTQFVLKSHNFSLPRSIFQSTVFFLDFQFVAFLPSRQSLVFISVWVENETSLKPTTVNIKSANVNKLRHAKALTLSFEFTSHIEELYPTIKNMCTHTYTPTRSHKWIGASLIKCVECSFTFPSLPTHTRCFLISQRPFEAFQYKQKTSLSLLSLPSFLYLEEVARAMSRACRIPRM